MRFFFQQRNAKAYFLMLIIVIIIIIIIIIIIVIICWRCIDQGTKVKWRTLNLGFPRQLVVARSKANQMKQYSIRLILYVVLYYVFNYAFNIPLYSTFNALSYIQLRIQHSTIHFIFNSLFTHSIIYSKLSTIYSTFNFNF